MPLYDAAAVSPFQGSAAAYRRTDIFPSQDLLHRVRAQAVKNSVTESASSTNARTAQLKVLISAYACEPDKGSEAAVGWNWVLQISRSHEVWVITRENNQERIEKAAATKPLPNVHWVYFDLPRWARFWEAGGAWGASVLLPVADRRLFLRQKAASRPSPSTFCTTSLFSSMDTPVPRAAPHPFHLGTRRRWRVGTACFGVGYLERLAAL